MMIEHNNRLTQYQIKIEGHLDHHWQAWFEGLTIINTTDGYTLLSGLIRDQAELHGILRRINNLGLVLVSVNRQPSKN